MPEGSSGRFREVAQGDDFPDVKNTREVERDELYERLERRADVVIELKKKLSAVGPEMAPKDFNVFIDAEVGRVTRSFPEFSQRVYRAAIATFEQEHDQDVLAPFEQEDLETGLNDFIHMDEDGAFLYNLREIAVGLKRKHAFVNKVSTDRSIAREAIAKDLGKDPLSEHDVRDIRFDGIHTAVILDDDVFDTFTGFPNAGGVHFPYSSVSVIRSSQPDIASVIRHESIHNLLESASDIRRDKGKELPLTFSNINRQAAPPNQPRLLLKYLKELRTWDLLDGFHDELLAELDNVERNVFPGLPSTDQKTDKLRLFSYYADRYSTAGWGSWALIDELVKTGVESRNPEVKVAASSLAFNYAKQFGQTVETMRQSIDRAQKISPEANERVHALFMVLPPSKYRHIPKYLDHAYGSEEVVN